MCALTYLMTHYLVGPIQRSRTRLLRVSNSTLGLTLAAAAATLAVTITGGLESIVNEAQLTWNRLRLLSRDEAGYTTQTVIMTALLAALAIAAGAIIYTKVIDKANSIDLNGNTGTGS
jgi:hypothetical protein